MTLILDGASYRAATAGVQTLFNEGLGLASDMWSRMALTVPSVGPYENYEWLGDLPVVRPWIGDRQLRQLRARHMTLANLEFESSLRVTRRDMEDDRLGMIRPKTMLLGQSMGNYRNQLVFDLLNAGGGAWVNPTYDAVPLLSAAHPLDPAIGGVQANIGAPVALGAVSFNVAYSRMVGRTDDLGRPLGLVPTHLVYGSANRQAAEAILTAQFLAGGASNPDYGRVEPFMAPWITGTEWFLAVLNMPIRPVVFQDRIAPELESQEDANSDAWFMRGEVRFGARMVCNAGPGLWHLIDGNLGA